MLIFTVSLTYFYTLTLQINSYTTDLRIHRWAKGHSYIASRWLFAMKKRIFQPLWDTHSKDMYILAVFGRGASGGETAVEVSCCRTLFKYDVMIYVLNLELLQYSTMTSSALV